MRGTVPKPRHLMRSSSNPTCRSWRDMLRRCCDARCKDYVRYGARGITVCQRWHGSFEAFVEDMGPRPGRGYSIDRIDNDGGYWCGKCDECVSLRRPVNCRWATRTEQVRNRRKTAYLTVRGVRKSIPEWAELVGIDCTTLYQRLYLGWEPEKIVTQPVAESHSRSCPGASQ